MDSVGRAHLARQWSLPAARRSLSHKTYVELSWRKPALAAAPVVVLHISNKSTFRERYDVVARHDEVVEGAYIDKRERLFERLCEQFVCTRRLGNARRTVVGE